MKGIYRLWTEGNDLGYHISENLEQLNEDIKNHRGFSKHLESYILKHPNAVLQYEVVKETETPEIDILEYRLPQISRVYYTDDLIHSILDEKSRIMPKGIKRAVDWFCECFPSSEYSVRFSVDSENSLIAYIFKNGNDYELYQFHCNGKPIARTDTSSSE